MIKKCVILSVVVLFALFSFAPYIAQADGQKSGQECQRSLDKKIYCKAHFMIENQDELGISDEQLKEIKALKNAVKKEVIKKDAEIELIAVDIKASLYDDPIDTAAINSLIDKKYDLKKEKAKYLVGAYAKLKSMLTEEQKQKCKSVCQKSHKE